MDTSRLMMRGFDRAKMIGLILGCALTVSACDSMDRAESVRKMNDGLEALQLGRTMDAVRDLKAAAQLDPTYAEPAYYLGQIYHIKLSELENAEQNYRQALERDPENPQIAYRLGSVLSDQQAWSDAETFYQQAVQKDPEFAKAWFRLGLAQQMQNKWADAVESFTSSISDAPSSFASSIPSWIARATSSPSLLAALTSAP